MIAFLIGVLIASLAYWAVWPLLRRLIWGLQESRAALQGKIELLEEKDRASNLRRQQVVRQYQELEAKRKGLAAKYNAMLQNRNDLARKHNQLVGKYNLLVRRISDLDTVGKAENERHSAAVLGLEREKREHLDREANLRQQLHAVEQENHSLERATTGMRAEREGLTIRVRDLEQVQQELQKQLSSVHQDLEQSQHKIRQMEESDAQLAQQHTANCERLKRHEKRVRRLRRERRKGEQQNEELAFNVRQIISEKETLEGERRALDLRFEQVRLENESLRARIESPIPLSNPSHIALPKLLSTKGYGKPDVPKQAEEAAEQQARPPLVVPSWVGTRLINIGLDFGTHSTKVIVRGRGEEKSRVLVLDKPTKDYPNFVVPSVVRYYQGRLFFGRKALEMSDGHLFRSLKVTLFPPAPNGTLQNGDYPPGTSPQLLVAFYLAWVLKEIRFTLGGARLTRSLNCAAPMAHIENPALKARYLPVLQAAWESSFGEDPVPVDQGIELATHGTFFQQLLSRAIPDREVRPFEVLPETLAPLVSLTLDPKAQTGLYMMVDMGAGTTEFSVSFVGGQGANRQIDCYADTSTLLGGDRFNRAAEEDKEIAANGSSKEKQLLSTFLKEYRSAWYAAFAKDKDGNPAIKKKFRQLRVVLSGGGLRREGLDKAIDEHPPWRSLFQGYATDYMVDWHRPTNIEFYGNGFVSIPNDSLAYLAVAHGLSLERKKWAEIRFPNEIEGSSE